MRRGTPIHFGKKILIFFLFVVELQFLLFSYCLAEESLYHSSQDLEIITERSMHYVFNFLDFLSQLEDFRPVAIQAKQYLEKNYDLVKKIVYFSLKLLNLLETLEERKEGPLTEITLFFYQDLNQNFKYDKGELPLNRKIYVTTFLKDINSKEIKKWIVENQNNLQFSNLKDGKIIISPSEELNKICSEDKNHPLTLIYLLKSKEKEILTVSFKGKVAQGSFVLSSLEGSFLLGTIWTNCNFFREPITIETPVTIYKVSEKVPYALNKQAYRFPNWEDAESAGYCCGMSISNVLLYENVYKADKLPYFLKKDDKIKYPVTVRGIGIVEAEDTLENVIRRDQKTTCFFKCIARATSKKILILTHLKTKEEVTKEELSLLKESLREGKPAIISYCPLSKAPGHAVVGVGVAQSNDYKLLLVYDNVFPYKDLFSVDAAKFPVISSEGEILNGPFFMDFIVVTRMSYIPSDVTPQEIIRESLLNLDKEAISALLKNNLSLLVVYGKIASLKTKGDYFYPVPNNKNVVVFFLKPEEKVNIRLKKGILYKVSPTKELEINVSTSSFDTSGRYIIDAQGNITKAFYWPESILIFILVTAIVIFLVLRVILKRRTKE